MHSPQLNIPEGHVAALRWIRQIQTDLDEANVTRYNEAIRSMTAHSQFILITHIKRTMQSVDVLYGVTMQEPGVSKLVSVRVNENAKSKEKPETTAAVA